MQIKYLKWIIPTVSLLVIGVCGYAVGTAHFTINGSVKTQVVLGEEYREKGCSAGIFGINLDRSIITTGNVDTSKIGDYKITYSFKNYSLIRPLIREVIVTDITIPELILAKGENLTLPLNSPYTEPGCNASDNYDGDLTSKIKINGIVDTSKAGDYIITYSVSDSSGNEARAQRNISVLPNSPLTMSLSEFTLTEFFKDIILPKTEDAGQEYINNTIFIGDSITENGLGWGFLPYNNVWAMHGIEPDTIRTNPITIYGGKEPTEDKKRGDAEMLVVDAAEKYKPERVIINIGSNAVYKMKPEAFAGDFKALLADFKAKSPDTKIIICSILPVDKRYDESAKTAYTTNNDKVNKINYALAELCREDGYKFLNIAEVLKDENGQAIPGYLYETDGIHPNKNVYPIMMEYIRNHAWI